MTLSRSLVPDLVALQAFVTVARYGSVTQAAAELNLSQGAVSRQIKELEGRLGLLLFERVRQRVILSENGRRLLPEAQALLVQAEALTMTALGIRNLEGVLRVASLPTFGTHWLLPRLPRFLERHPRIQVVLGARIDPFDLTRDRFDIAIHYGRPVWAGGVCTFLCRERVVPVISPEGRARMGIGAAPTAEEIARQPLLHLESRPRLWDSWLREAGVEDPAAFEGHRFDLFAMVIEAARAGVGIGLVPTYLVERDLAGGELVPLAPVRDQTDGAYYTVLPEDAATSALSGAFRIWMMEEVEKRPAS